ncbi:putative Haemin-degrading HemS.ChuX domain-containing protein [Candidatus Methylocalor cossyra]|uniref:Haemin-degrading HemS.ChuX domain-containing protein n=1 Tax=Candidatus Methylocalor cossyra TaxID=3108543 RepID=A0ABP1C5T6_9GAMM
MDPQGGKAGLLSPSPRDRELRGREVARSPWGTWKIRLPVAAFSDALAAAAHRNLPLIVSVTRADIERWYRGSIHRVRHTESRLDISGDGFALHFKANHLGSVLLRNDGKAEEAGPAVELYDRAERLLARIHSLPEPETNARWREIMDLAATRAL